MNSNQVELLLNQLLDCSFSIHKSVLNNDTEELDRLIKIKDEKIKLIEENKKFCVDLNKFKEITIKIEQQEKENLILLETKKNEISKRYKQVLANSKILNKYEINNNQSGAIIDIRE